jgi:hypothetical protein
VASIMLHSKDKWKDASIVTAKEYCFYQILEFLVGTVHFNLLCHFILPQGVALGFIKLIRFVAFLGIISMKF